MKTKYLVPATRQKVTVARSLCPCPISTSSCGQRKIYLGKLHVVETILEGKGRNLDKKEEERNNIKKQRIERTTVNKSKVLWATD